MGNTVTTDRLRQLLSLVPRAASAEENSSIRTGRVVGFLGSCLSLEIPGAKIGEVLKLKGAKGEQLWEVIAFRDGVASALAFEHFDGVSMGASVQSAEELGGVLVGDQLLGRVIDPLGRELNDARTSKREERLDSSHQVKSRRSFQAEPPNPLERRPIRRKSWTGVRAIDAFLPVGEGQRLGLFAGSGVGKSTLLAMLARASTADVVVIALVGERGREVKEFLESELPAEARQKVIMVVATSDTTSLLRARSAEAATSIAEYFRDQGKRVLFLMDSVTRYARALREIGLAAGEAPGRRGYPASVFEKLPRLLERTGNDSAGSITAIYTVLVEGGDMDEPIADEVRGLLDGHIVLSRELAEQAHFPAIDVPASVSRLERQLHDEDWIVKCATLRGSLSIVKEKSDLFAAGLIQPGQNETVDLAFKRVSALNELLKQAPHYFSDQAELESLFEQCL